MIDEAVSPVLMHRVGKNLHEGKIVLQDIMEGYLVVSCVDK